MFMKHLKNNLFTLIIKIIFKYAILNIIIMMSDYEDSSDYSDNENSEPITITYKTETDLIKLYNIATNPDDLEMVLEAIEDFNIEQKIDEYKEKLYHLYKNVVEVFINDENPTHIFDTGFHNNMMVNFIDCIYYNSIKGKEYEYLNYIYETNKHLLE